MERGERGERGVRGNNIIRNGSRGGTYSSLADTEGVVVAELPDMHNTSPHPLMKVRF